MKNCVNLVFCGKLGSGKTTLSKFAANHLDARWNSFGNTLRNIASQQSIPDTRENLQRLGEELILENRQAFCERTIAEAMPVSKTSLVLDGLRHKGVLDDIRQILTPQHVICIYVYVDEPTRMERIKIRDNVSIDHLRKLETHSTEAEVISNLQKAADFQIDNSHSTGRSLEQLIGFLARIHLSIP